MRLIWERGKDWRRLISRGCKLVMRQVEELHFCVAPSRKKRYIFAEKIELWMKGIAEIVFI